MDIACPTCLNPFLLNCKISATLCGHVFHTNCIETWLQMGNKTCPQCREFCSISFKLYLSATENVKKRDAIQADLDLAESEAKRRKSEMAKKSMLEFLFLVEEKVKTTWYKDDYTTKDGRTLLHWAADYGNLDIYRSIMDKVPDKNPKSKNGVTPLHCAADVGHLDLCQLILNNVTDKCPKNKDGHTPLHCSARKGHTLIHQMIMETLEDKNPAQIKGNHAGYTPLHAAAENGHVEVCRLIMDAVEDFSPKTKDKTTPLQLAAKNGHRAVQALILTYAAKKAAAALLEFQNT